MEIVYQDRRIVVAVKPSGVLSTDEPGGAPELLRAQLGTECIRTVHRLDAQVAGLMVFARSARAASILSEQVRERRFGKEYLAVVHGEPPEERGVLRAHQVVRVAGIGEGEITSGSFSPTLNKSIALARVPAATGDRAEVEIRGKWYPVRVVQPSFVRHGKPLI